MSDKQQNMLINADYSKIVQNKDSNAPGVTYLTGNVTMDQGTTKARGDEATIYQHAANAKDAQGRDISGDVARVVMIGKSKPAHLEQQQDSGGLFTATSDKIDYNADTSVAVLTGNVVVVQPGRVGMQCPLGVENCLSRGDIERNAFGDVFRRRTAGRNHGRDHLPDIAHAAVREDRLVSDAKARSIERGADRPDAVTQPLGGPHRIVVDPLAN